MSKRQLFQCTPIAHYCYSIVFMLKKKKYTIYLRHEKPVSCEKVVVIVHNKPCLDDNL